MESGEELSKNSDNSDIGKYRAEKFMADSGSIYEPDPVDEEFFNERSESDDSDFEEELGFEDDEVVVEDDEISDEELAEARERQKRTNAQLLELSEQLQREAIAGKAGCVTGQTTDDITVGDQYGYVSEYVDSKDEEDTPDEDGVEEECRSRKQRRALKVAPGTDWNTFQWKVGQRFSNRESFKDAVAKFAIFQGRNLSFVGSNRNRQQRLVVKCLEGCKFRLYASWDAALACYMVKSVDEGHKCVRNMEKNKQLKSTWLAKQLLEIFKARPHWPAAEIKETVKRAYRVLIKKDVAYKVKYNAHKMLHGSMQEHYLKVGRYLEMLKQTSPETRLVLVTDEEQVPPVFQRLFVCFEGVAKGWREGCRRVLCIDACFLKTFVGGQLLVAVGRDGNDQMFPVAWAVVEGENKDSWEWFLNEVRNCLMLQDGARMAIISDEHLSIIYAVEKVLPGAEHRHCARHIYAHWHKSFRGDEFKKLFWRAIKAYNVADYNDALEEMKKVNPLSVDAFKSYNPRLFCRHLMNTNTKVDVIVNNLAETFNGYIVNARTKHLLYMLEEIRTSLMQRLSVKRVEMQKNTGTICPKAKLKLDKAKKLAAECVVVPSTSTVFQVSEGMEVWVVDIEKRCCTCGVWDLVGIPCQHAVASIFFCHRNTEEYLSHWYNIQTYNKSYAYSIPPCVGERQWPKVDLLLRPPAIKIGPGRPRKNRIKDPFEDPKKPGKITRHGLQMKCTICKDTKHNKRRCPLKDTEIAQSSRSAQSKRQRSTRNEVGVGGDVGQGSQTGESNTILNATAQPTRTGRGGRVIRGGRGSRGGNTGGGRGTGGRGSRGGNTGGRGPGGRGTRGGRGARGRGNSQVTVGVGVLVTPDGSSILNPGMSTRSLVVIGGGPLGTQSSTAN